MSTAPLDGARRVKRRGDTVNGVASAMLMLGIVAGVPAALLLLVGNPIPEIPRDAFGSQVPVEFVLDVIVCIVWLAWAQLVSCLVAELVAGVRGRGLPWRVPFAAAAQQDLARRLVTAVLLLATAGQGLQSAPAPAAVDRAPAAATAAPAQSAAAVSHRGDTAAHRVADTRPTVHPERAGSARGATRQYVVMPPHGR